MIKTLKAWFFQTEQSVETILAGFLKTIRDLEQHAEDKIAEAAKHNALVDFYKAAEDEAGRELDKARAVIAKLKALFD